MYYPDLTPYEYIPLEDTTGTLLNIGWLSSEEKYPQGQVDEILIKKIGVIGETLINSTRGFHQCEFCQPYSYGCRKITIDSKELFLGSAEIRVKGNDGKTYASPNLICHYIKDHNYLPPQEFLDALKNVQLPPPKSNVLDWLWKFFQGNVGSRAI